MQVIRQTIDEIDFREQASLRLLPLWTVLLLAIVIAVVFLATTRSGGRVAIRRVPFVPIHTAVLLLMMYPAL